MSKNYHYNIHNITTVCSNVWLPELASFLVPGDQASKKPNIWVHVDEMAEQLPTPQNGATSGQAAAYNGKGIRSIVYDEHMGRLGFRAKIDIHDPEHIEVLAAPILRSSPHVLYTNLVEPILRWNFVEKGYALVHGACLAQGEDAFLITAKTDTGKTTTILRILDQDHEGEEGHETAAFLSDDLTLITPTGAALSYPKPLTISYHTMAAVNSPMLSRIERLTLPLQSRVHSRSGRRFALFLAKTRLPMATINMLIQRLIPPPKYAVNQLVPDVKLAKGAELAGLFVIERGGRGEVSLGQSEAMEILLQNCDDAYGFPPYHVLEHFLRHVGDTDLRDIERTIVTQAFRNLPALLLRSTTLDWAQRIPAFMQRAINSSLGTRPWSGLLPNPTAV